MKNESKLFWEYYDTIKNNPLSAESLARRAFLQGFEAGNKHAKKDSLSVTGAFLLIGGFSFLTALATLVFWSYIINI